MSQQHECQKCGVRLPHRTPGGQVSTATWCRKCHLRGVKPAYQQVGIVTDIDPRLVARARRRIAGRAIDADDLRHLLTVLGLTT
tara:strand:+ start:127 stop:378 length:252 start_codon:yes stop_codon:yes gene_type:complete